MNIVPEKPEKAKWIVVILNFFCLNLLVGKIHTLHPSEDEEERAHR